MPINRIANELYEKIMNNREKYMEAFIAETGLKPSECEIVEKRNKNEIAFYIRKRINK